MAVGRIEGLALPVRHVVDEIDVADLIVQYSHFRFAVLWPARIDAILSPKPYTSHGRSPQRRGEHGGEYGKEPEVHREIRRRRVLSVFSVLDNLPFRERLPAFLTAWSSGAGELCDQCFPSRRDYGKYMPAPSRKSPRWVIDTAIGGEIIDGVTLAMGRFVSGRTQWVTSCRTLSRHEKILCGRGSP